jgi:hypothetical protein
MATSAIANDNDIFSNPAYVRAPVGVSVGDLNISFGRMYLLFLKGWLAFLLATLTLSPLIILGFSILSGIIGAF